MLTLAGGWPPWVPSGGPCITFAYPLSGWAMRRCHVVDDYLLPMAASHIVGCFCWCFSYWVCVTVVCWLWVWWMSRCWLYTVVAVGVGGGGGDGGDLGGMMTFCQYGHSEPTLDAKFVVTLWQPAVPPEVVVTWRQSWHHNESKVQVEGWVWGWVVYGAHK